MEISVNMENIEEKMQEYNASLLSEIKRIQQPPLTAEQFEVLHQNSEVLRSFLDGAMADISAQFSTLSNNIDLKHGEVIFGQGLAALQLDHLVEGAQQMAEKIDFAIEGAEGNQNT